MWNYLFFFISLLGIGFIFPILSISNIFSKTKKDIVYDNIRLIRYLFSFKLFRISKHDLSTDPNIMYFCNHRSFSDFFVDTILVRYSSKMIGRYLVLLLFPLFFIFARITNCGYFIKRTCNNIEEFFNKLEKNRKNDKFNNILVYPEGTRRPYQVETCMLKKGFIFHSYNMNLPIQLIITKNKEDVIDEKNFVAKKNAKMYVYYSEVIYPDYKRYNRDEYYEYVQHMWNYTWKKVFKTDNITVYSEIDQTLIHNNNNYQPPLFRLFKFIIVFLYFLYLYL
jgi:1-acyl-sn-glycerol-3-phosphate acyltransferase